MCHEAPDDRPANCVTYCCPNGCVHLVWNNVTLHMRPSEWDLLARTVAQTDRVVREDRERILFSDGPSM